jgi:hypothetical protein
MSFDEPIEQRYNDLLRQRIALEGELAMLRKNQEIELAAERSSRYKFLLAILLLPLCTFVCNRKTDPSVYEYQIAVKSDSIKQLLSEQQGFKLTEKDSIHYVIQQGDMLISLGQLFYNDSTAGYQIGKDNGFSTERQYRKLLIGDTLTIHFR